MQSVSPRGCLALLAVVSLTALSTVRADPTAPEHWAYQPLVRPAVPATQLDAWVRTPVDSFILAKLEAKGMAPAPALYRRALLRRVTFDLVGLPPTPADIDQFLADPAPDAYEKIVDRLLASPHYGERWARHWMDVIHFAETHGHDQDVPRENAWPYRDYLIRSFNRDKPYARFIEEQLAGDVLWPDDPEGIIATGFLAAGPWDESSQQSIKDDTVDKKVAQYLDRDDMVTTAFATVSAATVHCARCHHHKFDPISQAEYYGLQACFAGIDRANRTYDVDPRVRLARQALLKHKAALEGCQRLGLTFFMLGQEVDNRLSKLPAPSVVYAATHDFKSTGSFRPAQGCRPVQVLRRGDVNQPAEPAAPGALACVAGLPHRFKLDHPNDEGARRATLAKWFVDPRNVLTWRTIVNRVWHYHFGRGIAATPNDLGKMGIAPTHPELLDWLAVWFRDQGGSLKRLHKLLVTSAVYRQASTHNPACAKIDGDNLFLWRMNRVRLDAESVRDAVLAVSGKLDRRMGGPSVKQFIQTPGLHVTPNVDYVNFDVDNPAAFRRSVYRFLFRTLPDPFMESLDCPDASQFMPVRTSSVTALQALAMLNDRFMVRQCEHFAQRVGQLSTDKRGQVGFIYHLALGRPPSAKEVAALGGYAEKYGLANACRVILNSNEFMFLP